MTDRLLGVAAQITVMAIVVSVVLLFLGIGILVLIHVCVLGRAFGGLRAAARADGSDEVRGGLSVDDLEKFPCYDFKAGEKGSSPMDCAVCLESFKMGDRCRLLPACKHSFHAPCVDSWLLRSPVCPICRASADHRKGCEASSESGVVMVEIPLAPVDASTSQ